MKKLFPFGILILVLTAGGHAAPFMAIGDGAELFVTGTLAVRADDNIFLTESSTVDDIIYEIIPGVDLTFGKDAQVQGALTTTATFSNYADNSQLNTSLWGADFFAHYDDGKLKLGFNTGFHELNQNTADTRGLVRRDVFSTAGNLEFEMSQLTSLGAGVSYSHEDYKREGYTDSDNLTVPVNVFYKLTPKVDLSGGYSYHETLLDSLGDNSADHSLNVGARGDFTPKLTGRFTVGWTTRKVDTGGSDDTFSLDASFSWELTPKSSLQLAASNGFGTSPQGEQQKNFTINAALSTRLTDRWTANLGASYRSIDYFTRTDDYWEGTAGVGYSFNASVSVSGSYVYRYYESALPGSGFTNNVFSLSGSFRY